MHFFHYAYYSRPFELSTFVDSVHNIYSYRPLRRSYKQSKFFFPRKKQELYCINKDNCWINCFFEIIFLRLLQSFLYKKYLIVYMNLLVSHRLPLNPGLHLHLKSLTLSSHCPFPEHLSPLQSSLSNGKQHYSVCHTSTLLFSV